MRRLGLFLWLCCLPLAAQTTTTYTGTIKDLTGTAVTSGRITFTLRQGVGVANIAGTGAFVSNTVSCLISQSGSPVSSVDGVSPCTITSNTSLTPTGTYYQMCIQPQFVTPGSCINAFATGGSVDLSTLVPTPATQPSYGVASTALANTWNLLQTFGSGFTSNANSTINGTLSVSGTTTMGTTKQFVGPSGDVQGSINAMSAAGGGTVELLPGTYSGNPITSLPSNVSVRCAAYLGCILQYTSSVTLGSSTAITNHAGLIDLVFDFQNNNAGLTLDGFQGSTFSVWVRNTGTAHPLTLTATANYNNFYNNELPFIYITNAAYGLTLDGHTNLTACGGGQIGFGGAIFGNHFGLLKIGSFQSPADEPTSGDGVGGNGIDFTAGVDTNNFDNIFVTLNSTNATGDGIVFNSYCGTQYGDVAGNRISHYGIDALDASFTGYAIYAGQSQSIISVFENGANITSGHMINKTAGSLSGLSIGYAWATRYINNGSNTLLAPAFETGGFIANGDVVLGRTDQEDSWIVRPNISGAKSIHFATAGAGPLDGFDVNTIAAGFNFTAANQSLNLQNSTAATSSANQFSPCLNMSGFDWNGTASQASSWSLCDSANASGTPTFHTLALAYSGVTSNIAFSVPTLLIQNGANYSKLVSQATGPNAQFNLPAEGANSTTTLAVSFGGTTGSIGGSALTAGQCASGTVSITGVTAGMPAYAAASDGSYQPGYTVEALGTASNTATVYVCAIASGTPTAKTYNVRVIQ